MILSSGDAAAKNADTPAIDPHVVVKESLKVICDSLERAVSTRREQGIDIAVDKLYRLFIDSDSATTGIPIVIRYIEPYINVLLDNYETCRNKKLGAIILKLLLIYRVDSPDFLQLFGCIYYETRSMSLDLWPIEFLRNAANYFARFYGVYVYSKSEKGDVPISGLCNFINNFHLNCQTAYNILLEDAKTLLNKGMEPEAFDCLVEANLLTNVKALTTLLSKKNIRGFGEYVHQCAIYGDHNTRNQTILALAQVYLALDMACDAFILLLSLGFFAYAKDVLYTTSHYNKLLQMAYLVAYNGSCGYFSKEDFIRALSLNSALKDDPEGLEKQASELWKVACNSYTHIHLLSLADELELNVPRGLTEILKADQLGVNWNTLDVGYVRIGDYLMNAFANAGLGTDRLLASHKIYVQKQRKSSNKAGSNEEVVMPAPSEMDLSYHPEASEAQSTNSVDNALAPEGSKLLDTSGSLALLGQSIGAASLGLIYLYHGNGHGQAFNVISRYFSSPNHWIRAGAALAIGLSSANTTDPTGVNPVLRMLGGIFNLFYVNQNEPFTFSEYFPYSCSVFQKQLLETHQNPRFSYSDLALRSKDIYSTAASSEQNVIVSLGDKDFSIGISDVDTSFDGTEDGVGASQPSIKVDTAAKSLSIANDTQKTKQYLIENFKRILSNPHKQRLYEITPHKNFVSPIVNIEVKSEHDYINLSQAYAALGIGIAYAGTNNKLASEILFQRLCLSSINVSKYVPILEKNPRATACLALGLVLTSTADLDAAYFILRVMAGNTKTQRLLRFFPLKPIGLGTIFLRSGRSEEGRLRIKEFCSNMYARLLQIKVPDSKQERTQVPNDEEQLHLAAYIQSMVMVYGYAFTGNVSIISEIMQGIYEAISGRVAAEETISLNGFNSGNNTKSQSESGTNSASTGRSTSKSSGFNENRSASANLTKDRDKPPRSIRDKPRGDYRGTNRSSRDSQGGSYDVSKFAADSGVPLQLPNDDFILWPGENLDPVGILVAGLGLVAGNDPVCSMMVTRFINRIMQYGNSYAKRACPLALALMNLSRPTPELTDMLFRMASQSDENLSINAILALGLVGCGSCNSRIAQSLRQLADSKYFNTRTSDLGMELTNMILTAIKLSLGLVHCGRGLMHISVTHEHGKVVSHSRLACLAALVMMLASNSRVMMRPKFTIYFFLLAGALHPKYLVAVDAANKQQANSFKIGTYLDTVSLPDPFRLSGYQTNTTPMVLSHAERAIQNSDTLVPMVSILEDVVVTTQTVQLDITVD